MKLSSTDFSCCQTSLATARREFPWLSVVEEDPALPLHPLPALPNSRFQLLVDFAFPSARRVSCSSSHSFPVSQRIDDDRRKRSKRGLIAEANELSTFWFEAAKILADSTRGEIFWGVIAELTSPKEYSLRTSKGTEAKRGGEESEELKGGRSRLNAYSFSSLSGTRVSFELSKSSLLAVSKNLEGRGEEVETQSLELREGEASSTTFKTRSLILAQVRDKPFFRLSNLLKTSFFSPKHSRFDFSLPV